MRVLCACVYNICAYMHIYAYIHILFMCIIKSFNHIELDDYLATSEPEEMEQKEANLEKENEQSDDDEVIEEKRPDISKNEIISTLSNFKQYAAQSKFENFTCEMLSLIYKFEKLIYNEPKEMVQNTMDKYLV